MCSNIRVQSTLWGYILKQIGLCSLHTWCFVCNNNNNIITSANRTILLPSGQKTWSTWGLTCSHLSSEVRRLVWKARVHILHTHIHMNTQTRTQYVHTNSISVLECPMLQMMQPFFIRSRCSLPTTFLLPADKHRWSKAQSYVCSGRFYRDWNIKLASREPQ